MSRFRFNTPLRYPGGKQKLTPFIREVLETNDLVGGHYAEPYAGGAGIAIELLLNDYVSHIHLNDKSFPIYAFWRSVLLKTDELCQLISDTRLSVPEWRRQRAILRQPWHHSQLEVGFSLFYQNRCNRSGIPTGGIIGGLDQTGKWKMNARFTKTELIRRIKAIADKRSFIVVKNWDAENFITDYIPWMPEKTLIYCDPPYYHKDKRLYVNKYSPADHARIAATIQNTITHRWLLSYDSSADVVALYSDRHSFEYQLQYHAGGANKGKELVVISDNLKLPKRSSIPCIDVALPLAA